MNLTSAAIEAAAEALYENRYEYQAWDEAKSPDSWREQARVALQAAAPHMCPDIHTQRTEWPDIPRARGARQT